MLATNPLLMPPVLLALLLEKVVQGLNLSGEASQIVLSADEGSVNPVDIALPLRESCLLAQPYPEF